MRTPEAGIQEDSSMGELIRNIREIRLGEETLMVEENEGYSAGQGKLIHIQNRDFRFLISEKAFVQLLTTILRAKEEKDYYKKNRSVITRAEKERMVCKESRDEKKVSGSFGRMLKEADIRYRYVESGNRIITFLVNNEDYSLYKKVLRKHPAFQRETHVYGREMGYDFLYQMRPFELYQCNGVYIEVFFQLPCMSLTPNTWIPLDRHIQKQIWDRNIEKDGLPVLDEAAYYIFRLCWSIFHRGYFSSRDKTILDQHEDALKDPTMRDLMPYVFFGYSSRLLELLSRKEYDCIIQDYYQFNDY